MSKFTIIKEYEDILKECVINITDDEIILTSTYLFKNQEQKQDVINYYLFKDDAQFVKQDLELSIILQIL